MRTEREKMLAGELYDPLDPELVLATQPGQAGPALSAIETASRSALDELRKLLRQIRDPEDADEAAAPTLGDLPALIDKLRRAGLDVSCHSTGQPSPYDTAVELSAHGLGSRSTTAPTSSPSRWRTKAVPTRYDPRPAAGWASPACGNEPGFSAAR